MAIKTFHPFPARMAPELALDVIGGLSDGSVILDPMSGSGTVLREASLRGFAAIGFDTDPLAVLMATVATRTYDTKKVFALSKRIIKRAQKVDGRKISIPWIDGDPETKEFVSYWFAVEQRRVLRKIADTIAQSPSEPELDVVKLALSRIIVTKESKASLARDTSHSRPHKVLDDTDYDVYAGLQESITKVCGLIDENKLVGDVKLYRGDARSLKPIQDETIDAIITSPPYLNAIDYLRGHKLALVWLGYSVPDIRIIRNGNIGAEKGLKESSRDVETVAAATGDLREHSPRIANMIRQYACDLILQLKESSRVLKPGGKALYVVGNSCLRGRFINNSKAVIAAAELNGLALSSTKERELPNSSRYLPMLPENGNSLAKRMRTESVLEFKKAVA